MVAGASLAAVASGTNASCEPGEPASAWPWTYGDEADHQEMILHAKSIVGDDAVCTEPDELEAFMKDPYSFHTSAHSPAAVVAVQSTQQVSQLMAQAHKLRIPVIAAGSRTALEGHCLPQHRGIVLDLSGMREVLRYDPVSMDATVQPGISWNELNEWLAATSSLQVAAEPAPGCCKHANSAKPGSSKLFFPVDPGPGASIGGMASTGCSGTNAVRYGTMKAWVLGLTAVLADGTVVRTGTRARKCAAGYNLTELLVGSEGTLGVVTEVTVKLAPVPPATAVLTVHFQDVRSACRAVHALQQAAVPMQAVELLDSWAMRGVTLGSGLPVQPRPALFIKLSGSDAVVEHTLAQASDIVAQCGGDSVRAESSTEGVAKLWQARKVALWDAPMLREHFSDSGEPLAHQATGASSDTEVWITDVCVPLAHLPDVAQQAVESAHKHGLLAPLVAHAGDGNIHTFMLIEKGNAAQAAAAAKANAELVKAAQAVGGTCTGEHGVGSGKRYALPAEIHGPALALQASIKAGLDSRGILNPGKVFPDVVMAAAKQQSTGSLAAAASAASAASE